MGKKEMNVADLIAALQSCPQDAKVLLPSRKAMRFEPLVAIAQTDALRCADNTNTYCAVDDAERNIRGEHLVGVVLSVEEYIPIISADSWYTTSVLLDFIDQKADSNLSDSSLLTRILYKHNS